MVESPSKVPDAELASRRDFSAKLPEDMPGWMAGTITRIDKFSFWVGRWVAWLTLPIIFAMVYEITVRYAFMAPTIWAYEVSRMFYGALFVLGTGYALSVGVHIRSDFLYNGWTPKTQGKVDTVLYVIFFFPCLLVLLWVSTEWAWISVVRGERSIETAWAPLLGPLKTCLPIGVALLIVQGISELLKSIYAATRGNWPHQ